LGKRKLISYYNSLSSFDHGQSHKQENVANQAACYYQSIKLSDMTPEYDVDVILQQQQQQQQ